LKTTKDKKELVWKQFLAAHETLSQYLDEVTEKVIREALGQATDEVAERVEQKALPL
jgi:hypothetical protein